MQKRKPVVGGISQVAETPFLQVLNTLFSTIFGRRLGTKSDGTTLRKCKISWCN